MEMRSKVFCVATVLGMAAFGALMHTVSPGRHLSDILGYVAAVSIVMAMGAFVLHLVRSSGEVLITMALTFFFVSVISVVSGLITSAIPM